MRWPTVGLEPVRILIVLLLPMYIIAWSYNKDTVKEFENMYSDVFPFLNCDTKGMNNEWTEEVFEFFEENICPFFI